MLSFWVRARGKKFRENIYDMYVRYVYKTNSTKKTQKQKQKNNNNNNQNNNNDNNNEKIVYRYVNDRYETCYLVGGENCNIMFLLFWLYNCVLMIEAGHFSSSVLTAIF